MSLFTPRLYLSVMLFLSAPIIAFADLSERIQGVRSFLDNGSPEQAISTAEALLHNTQLHPSDRMALLALIAEAEEIRAQYSHYQDVSHAVLAQEAMLKEFPDHPNASEYRWRRASLLWHAGKFKLASAALREMLAKDQKPVQQRRAWLLLARTHLQQEHLALARSDLLQYGLNVDDNSVDQAIGLSWMAMVDWREARSRTAFDTLDTVYANRPEVITSEPEIYAAYIQLLYGQAKAQAALHHANIFLDHYLTSKQAPQVRLLRADITSKVPAMDAKSIKEYGILAHDQAESVIGRQAFMRKLMLENRHETKKEKLLPVMASLKKIADQNQLSTVEDEATLDIARLWRRFTNVESASGLAPAKPALLAYAHAASSTDVTIKGIANKEGSALLKQLLHAHLDQQQWLAAVRLWRAFPQLRPAFGTARKLRFGMAHAMRMIMMLDPAEAMLAKLYDADQNSVQGQRIMTERIKLWLDRNDKDAVEKSMRWLNAHEFTIYRPEILATIARIQLQQQHAQAARQTLSGVKATDLAIESRASYWLTVAEISESLSQWHSAAQAWQHYRKSQGANANKGLRHQADALFMAEQYAEAKNIYISLPKELHDTAWQYRLAICLMHAGQNKDAVEKLQALADSGASDTFVSLAKLALADQLAGSLLKETP